MKIDLRADEQPDSAEPVGVPAGDPGHRRGGHTLCNMRQTEETKPTRSQPATRRLPAEWEPQGAVLISWPRSEGDWAPWLDRVVPTYQGLAAAIARHAPLLVLSEDPATTRELLTAAGVAADRATVVGIPADDTWTRDFGPITVLETTVGGTVPVCLDFGFNGWGLKFAAQDDNQVSRRLHAAGLLGRAALRTNGLILEGGSIESDGCGTILTTAACLMSPNRNPHLDRAGVEAALAEHLGATRVLWLDHGHLEGDDTDAHVDTIARLCPGDTIAYVRCDDASDPHFPAFAALEAQLQTLRTASGAPYRLVPLPWAKAQHAPDDGRRLPATYANILFINGAVLVPTYEDPIADAAALAAMRLACPDLIVEGVPSTALVLQHGSLHCSTMQIPAEVFQP